MNIAVIGVNHKRAPIYIRERVAFSESRKIEAIDQLLDLNIDEVIILSTCNRSEIYICSYRECSDFMESVKRFYREFFSIEDIEDYLFELNGREAVEHIFKVSMGLDSIVLGEDQILGQVKDALQVSMELGASKKILNKLFREAITCAKDVKNQFHISEIPLSTSYIGVKLLKEKLGNLNGKKALVVGIGDISQLTLKYLIEENLEEIYITNRTHGKLATLPSELKAGVEEILYNDRYTVVDEVDIIISATSAPHTVFKEEKMPTLNKELFIMDLAVPRDVEDKIGYMDNVTLYDIDDLSYISEKNMERRKIICNDANKIIYVRTIEFINWINASKIDPVIGNLNVQCEEIRKDTMEYLNRKLNHVDCRDMKIIDKMLQSALKRVIRRPILKLKSLENEDEMDRYVEILEELFD